MKSSVAIVAAVALVWGNTPTLAGEKPRGLTNAERSAVTLLFEKAGETCRKIAVQAKAIDLFNYCLAEVLRPYVRGQCCIGFVAHIMVEDPGFKCDSKGLMYYEALVAAPTTEENFYAAIPKVFYAAIPKVLAKYTFKDIVSCALNNGKNNELLACLTKGEKRMREIFNICTSTTFNVEPTYEQINRRAKCGYSERISKSPFRRPCHANRTQPPLECPFTYYSRLG
jgi:hypothetical protein